MLLYKAWRESSMRFLISAGVIAALCLMYALLHKQFYPGIAHEHPGVRNYLQYIHWTVFGGVVRGLLQLSCLLLGLGGLQRDRRQNTLGFTLALPVSRFRIVASRAALGLVQVLALTAIPTMILPAASHLAGQQLPFDYAVRFIPLWFAGGCFTFAISFVASALFASEYVSLAVAYVTYIFYLAAVRHPYLGRVHLHVADFMSGMFPHYLDRGTMLWSGSYALLPIAGFFAAAAVLVLLSSLVVRRQDL
jgi:ABC-2 type transport system permease protein